MMTQNEFLERLHLVLQALRDGDLSPRVRPWDDPLSDKVGQTMNETIEHLVRVIAEVSRVQYEVGILGQLGPVADVPGARGDWKGMLDRVNQLAGNLTNQIRNFSSTVSALERGEAGARATAPCHGELRQLRDAINRVIEKSESEMNAPAA